jgi:hypothetical protein
MNDKLAQCFLAWAKGKQRYEGVVNDQAVDKVIGAVDSKAKFARESHYYDRDISMAAPFSPAEEAQGLFSQYTGIDARQLGAYFRDPSALLGEPVVEKINALYRQHLADPTRSPESWKDAFRPQIKALRKQVEAGLPPQMRDYAAKYFDHHEVGGEFYPPGADFDPLMTPVRNVVGNLVSWSPIITVQNGFEFLPKAMAHAGMSGASPLAVFKAMGNLMSKSGGNPFQMLPEWQARGIYGLNRGTPKPWNYLQQSENLLRNLSASLGEVLGQAPEYAVEKVAFVPRLGNSAQVYWTNSGRNSVTLMRYSISAAKMYSGMLGAAANGIRTGNLQQAANAAGAFAAFSAMTALQTGGASAIPAPVAFLWQKADPDSYEALKEFDKEFPALNMAKYLGMDLVDKTQPLAMPVLGLGYSLVNQDINSAATSAAQVPMDLKEGEFGVAGARLVDSIMGVGQLARIPGINLSTKRLSRALVKQLEEDSEINMDYLKRSGEVMGFGSIDE